VLQRDGCKDDGILVSRRFSVLFFIRYIYCTRSYIPEGTAVSSHFYSIQRDPRNFSPGADIFWPERWLIAENRDYVTPLPSYQSSTTTSQHPLTRPKDFVHNVDAFTPFSYGPANCVGKFLALQEIRTLVCHTMQRLEMRFVDGYDTKRWFDEMEDFLVVRQGSLPVVITTRK